MVHLAHADYNSLAFCEKEESFLSILRSKGLSVSVSTIIVLVFVSKGTHMFSVPLYLLSKYAEDKRTNTFLSEP